jgi:hypothetical protein
MKGMLLFILFIIGIFVLVQYCENQKDPYEEGSHFSYRIECENGFIYKYKNGATMQIFNSDGTPLRCGKKIY